MSLRQLSLRQRVAYLLSALASTGALALIGISPVGCGSSNAVGVRTFDTALYVRSDSDATTVYAPRVHAGAKLGDSFGLDATYAVDAWTGASIDVVTAATSAIHEVRREVTGGASYEGKNVSLSGAYRYSTENDYWSNGGVANLAIDMADNNFNLSFSVLGSKDIVGRSGDAYFRRPQDSLGGRVSASQVLDKNTVLQLSAEVVRLTGYLASPYRFVGVGGGGLCAGAALDCVPETHPHERLRTALGLKLRRALGGKVSAGVEYRHYFDDWGVRSETVAPELSFLVGGLGTLSLSYRFYTQTRADFYQPEYTEQASELHYFSRDRKLSALYSQRVGAEYLQGFELGQTGSVLELGLRAGVSRIIYKEFVGLRQVDALELTGSVGLNFR